MAAATVGRDPDRACRPDWDKVKDDVMRFVVYHKFSQNVDIRNKLLETGESPLFEQDYKRGDQYWAVDKNGVGRNQLGVTLMEVREVLREDARAWRDYLNEIKECEECAHLADVRCKAHGNSTKPSDIYLASLRF